MDSGRAQTIALIGIIIIGGLLVVGVGMGLSGVFRSLFAEVEQFECAKRLEALALAMEAYDGEYSVYPPAYLADPQGRPAHSWRVLLLPYLGSEAEKLYKRYDFNEPYNGPHNRQLADEMPLAFGCPCDPGPFQSQTSFLGITEPRTGQFAGPPPTTVNRPKKKAKKPLTKYLMVEVSESGVNWLEPRDIVFSSTADIRKGGKSAVPFGLHLNGTNVLLNDGTTVILKDDALRSALGPPGK